MIKIIYGNNQVWARSMTQIMCPYFLSHERVYYNKSIKLIKKINQSKIKFKCTSCLQTFLVILNQNKILCKKCSGTGFTINFKICDSCNGYGTYDWIEEIFKCKKP